MLKRRIVIIGVGIMAALLAAVVFWTPLERIAAQMGLPTFGDEPDLPDFARYKVDKEDFMLQRSKNIASFRGLSEDEANPSFRMEGIRQLERQEAVLISRRAEGTKVPVWTEIGPAPIPNAQVGTAPSTTASGRVTAIAVHPTNPDIVYVGTAQGGLYRSLDGGSNWVRLMDGALSLAIGTIAIAPSQPETVFVGTGEPQFSGDSFFGVGIYRISGASGANPTVEGPFNAATGGGNVFTGRAVSKIVVHPTDPNIVFASSTSGIGGLGGIASNILPDRGIFRSTNALSSTPTFSKLNGLLSGSNRNVRDIAIDPLNPNLLVANVVFAVNPASSESGIYVSTDALAPAPTFTQRVVFTNTSTSELTAEFAVHHTSGPNPTIYAATGNGGGRVLINTDGGTVWTEQIDNNFCSPQCFYNIALGVDPTNAGNVFLGGAPSLVFGRSTDGGVAFTNNAATAKGLHVDSHAIAIAPSQPSTIYFGSDGGIYRTNDSGSSWTSLNNTQFKATQFMSIDVHPTDPNFSIGGTQDNGTNFFAPDRTWRRIDFGDGGYAVIDQNATNTTNVRMYHTYFNRTTLQGYGTIDNVNNASDGNWTFRGCQSAGATANGITCDGVVEFYAPLQRGPGNPNTIYYGSDRLYRSADNGLNHTVVSQNPITAGVPISAIGISPQDDNVRVVGMSGGGLFGTTTGSNVLNDLDPLNVIPNAFVGRVVVDPNDSNTAYVSLNVFGVANVVWKTTGLNATPPTWSPASNGLPAVPVNALVIDQRNSANIYAGTDIGVFASFNGGTTWAPFGLDLPRIAVFGAAIANGNPRKLRIATHGRGMFEIPIESAVKSPFDYDGDGKSDYSVWRPSDGTWYLALSNSGSMYVQPWGQATDKIAPADYDGDGVTDMAVYRPGEGKWYVIYSQSATINAISFGLNGDVPLPQDFDGDGRADFGIWRPSDGTWYLGLSASGSMYVLPFGLATDKPVPADFDGDGKAEIAVWRPSQGRWYVGNIFTGGFSTYDWGLNGDMPVVGDYSGDGKADYAVYRPSNQTWYRVHTGTFAVIEKQFGVLGDIPAPGDFDGDGKLDIATYRPSEGRWYVWTATNTPLSQLFGLNGDVPTESAFVY